MTPRRQRPEPGAASRREPLIDNATPTGALRHAAWAGAAPQACCALPGLSLDLAATAPQLAGDGNADFAISTGAARAQARLNPGQRQTYACNKAEAVRMFKAALATPQVHDVRLGRGLAARPQHHFD